MLGSPHVGVQPHRNSHLRAWVPNPLCPGGATPCWGRGGDSSDRDSSSGGTRGSTAEGLQRFQW
eukprot:9433326-Alexandrium_andersonii.AAC.1